MVECEAGFFLRVTPKYKIINKMSCLNFIRKNYRNDPISKIKECFVGSSVMTSYGNNRVYIVDDIDFDKTPHSQAIKIRCDKGKFREINLKNYYKEIYGKSVQDDQPLFIHYNNKKEKADSIHLIPELCFVTKIDESISNDENYKKNLRMCIKKPNGN